MASEELVFRSRPPLLKSLRRALFTRRRGLKKGERLPSLQGEWIGARVDEDNLRQYIDICGLDDGESIPLLYPHVIASPLHLSILTVKAFPLKLLGAVHSRNHIVQHRVIGREEVFHFACRIAQQRVLEKGLEFDFTTEVRIGEEMVWESISTFFLRGKFGESDAPSLLSQFEPLPQTETLADWLVAPDKGKKYARITGDYNPIHVSRVLAKMFGFNRDLLHGFCALATTLQHLPPLTAGRPRRLDVAFKGPVYLALRVFLKNVASTDSQRFELYCGDNPRPSIVGDYRNVAAGTVLPR